MLVKQYHQILSEEVNKKGRAAVNDVMACAFTPLGSGTSFQLIKFIDELFNMPEMGKLEREWRTNNQDVLNTWQAKKVNFRPTNSIPNAIDAKRFVNDASIDTLCHLFPELVKTCIDNNNIALLQSFPSLQVMLYSQYYRIFDTTWKPNDQEVIDVAITPCAPYVDAVVTERFQAEIYKKVSKHITGMTTHITILSDIRIEKAAQQAR
jgi:hypothetical protein